MMRFRKRFAVAGRVLSFSTGALFLLLCGAESLFGQDGSDTTVVPSPPAITRGVELGEWWRRNAASYDPIPAQWLLHAEADYSFSLQTGNIEGQTHSGRGLVALRKKRSTLSVRGGVQSQVISLAKGVMEIEQTRYRVSPTLDYDFTPALGVQGGFFWEHDDAAFIETREIAYLGLKTIPYSSEKLTISVLPAFGYQYEQAILTKEERSFWTPYLEEAITWQPLQQLRIHHEANALFSLKDPDTYRWRLANALEIPVTSFLSVMFNYEIRYNSNPIPSSEVVRQLTGGQGEISHQDNELTVGFRLQY